MSLKYQAYAEHCNLDEYGPDAFNDEAVGPEREFVAQAVEDALGASLIFPAPEYSPKDRIVLFRVTVRLIGAPNVTLAKPLLKS